MSLAAEPSTILLVEDSPSLLLLYQSILQQAGYRVLAASTAREGLTHFRSGAARVVLLDLVLPDRDGLDLMQDMLGLRPDAGVIAMTAHGSIAKAVEAMRGGALEFLVKPFDDARLLTAVANAARAMTPERTLAASASGPTALRLPGAHSPFIGRSAAMQRIEASIVSVARSMATVFISGESGTGKELCAMAVHEQSPRMSGPFIALNCGAIPQDMLESEVFGHIKGSFAGALSDKLGAAAAADGGTLFLDEVCEMAPSLQTKLLRFLQTSTVVPVGAALPRKVNVRIVCATNRDPHEAVRRGQFRQDLFYRLYVVPIEMPPLRERGDDVIEIAEAALARFAPEEGKQFDGLSSDLRALFRRLPWPGNVRQVLNVMRNIVVMQEGGLITPAMLPTSLLLQADAATPEADDPPATIGTGLDALLDRPLAEVERLVIEATLMRHGGSVPKAARVLALAPSTLYRKIEAWGKP